MADYAIWSPNHSGRGGTSVIWLAVHTAEGATTATSLANYLANAANQVSYHDVCDDTTTIQCVNYNEEAWAMLGGNPWADQICCTGFAAWSRDTWLSHPGMLERIARWLAERSRARGIPLDHIGPAGVSTHASGVIGHWDYTLGAHDGTHTDPGLNFPWDYVITKARHIVGPTQTGDELMSQGTWEHCTKDSNGAIIAKRGYLCAPIGKTSSLVKRGWLSLATGWDDAPEIRVWFIGTNPDRTPNYRLFPDNGKPFALPKNVRRWWDLPDGTDQIAVEYTSLNPIGWCLELEPH
jgi:hypothetical protein